jgi:ubiquinone/menaquinone biosynthesis C-methylase UbiE
VNRLARFGHFLYNRTALPLAGRLAFGNNWPGAYLAASIEALPSSPEMTRVFHAAGFGRFERRPLWGGLVTLFIGRL